LLTGGFKIEIFFSFFTKEIKAKLMQYFLESINLYLAIFIL